MAAIFSLSGRQRKKVGKAFQKNIPAQLLLPKNNSDKPSNSKKILAGKIPPPRIYNGPPLKTLSI
jgi:hypothetical protein